MSNEITELKAGQSYTTGSTTIDITNVDGDEVTWFEHDSGRPCGRSSLKNQLDFLNGAGFKLVKKARKKK